MPTCGDVEENNRNVIHCFHVSEEWLLKSFALHVPAIISAQFNSVQEHVVINVKIGTVERK